MSGDQIDGTLDEDEIVRGALLPPLVERAGVGDVARPDLRIHHRSARAHVVDHRNLPPDGRSPRWWLFATGSPKTQASVAGFVGNWLERPACCCYRLRRRPSRLDGHVA